MDGGFEWLKTPRPPTRGQRIHPKSRSRADRFRWWPWIPRFLRKTIVIILVAILLFQLFEWTAIRLAGFLFNILLAWLLAISFDPLVTGLARRGMRRGLATTIVALGVSLAVGLVPVPLRWSAGQPGNRLSAERSVLGARCGRLAERNVQRRHRSSRDNRPT